MTLTAVRFVVPGQPVAKGRARSSLAKTKDGRDFIRHYTPADTRAYERSIRFEARIAMQHRAPIRGAALVLIVHAYLAIPPSWPLYRQREARAGLIVPIARPDWDNIGKVCSDAMNGTVYGDDSAIVDAVVRKRYSRDPRIEIEVRTLNPLRREEPELLDEDMVSET
jgi:Holliday junction resolvase RusA-like endonuclease